MSNIKYYLFFLFIVLTMYSCEKDKDPAMSEVVINELMPVNSTTVSDQNGEFDDWIELYNLTEKSVDISGYYLSDKKSNNTKWQFPMGTTISGKSYLVIWADGDTTQPGLHANFKLSSLGEKAVLSNIDKTIIDMVEYPAQTLEISYSRNPDGTGSFRWQNPTFNRTNNHP